MELSARDAHMVRGYAYQVDNRKKPGAASVWTRRAQPPAAAGRYEGSSEAAASNVPRIRWGAAAVPR